MVSRASRWPGDDHPLSGFHGGTAKAAVRAIKEASGSPSRKETPKPRRILEREFAVAVAKLRLEQLLSKLPPVPIPCKNKEVDRKDRVRPRSKRERTDVRKEWLLAHRIAQGGKCHYCFMPMDARAPECEHYRRPSLDHVVPLSKGGSDSFANTVAACRGCNNAKADYDQDYFMAHMHELRRKIGC